MCFSVHIKVHNNRQFSVDFSKVQLFIVFTLLLIILEGEYKNIFAFTLDYLFIYYFSQIKNEK